MVKVKEADLYRQKPNITGFNHPMVKVKVTASTSLIMLTNSFNHPMVKVKV